MAAEVIYSSTSGADVLHGHLFDGLKFWLSAKVPQRSRFINDLKANGGTIVQLEKTADVRIVDHARKQALPGTHSYTFIEESVRNGVLENFANHAVGPPPGAIRHVGSVTQPARLIRHKYTQEDERILWDWVNANPQTGGGTDGNEIYKQLEMKHPQHPWQSWRDHYRKSMKGRARPIYPPNNAPPTPPLEFPATDAGLMQRDPGDGEVAADEFDGFSEEDEEALMEFGQEIMDIHKENITAAWKKWAIEIVVHKRHSAEEWQAFWERRVRPRFLRSERKKAERTIDRKEASSEHTLAGVRPKYQATPSRSANDDDQISRQRSMQQEQTPKPRSTGPSHRPIVHIDGAVATFEQTEEVLSPLGNSILKRKRVAIEELPSSSPPSTKSPLVAKRLAKKTKEIASTPDQSPRRHEESMEQPLFLGDMLNDGVPKDTQEGASSPLGQQPSESLSEPDRTLRASTQALFQAETPDIEFDLALPQGGWGGDEDADHANQSESESEYGSAREKAPAPDTQAILQSTIPVPDLFIPDPDDPWNSFNPPSSPPLIMPSSPVADSESSSAPQAELDAKIDAILKDRMEQGYSPKQLIAVLNSTCTNIPLTEQVLQQMGPQNANFALPSNMRGVWTAEDDKNLHSSDAREVARLEPKHGAANVNARHEWLELMASE